MGEILVRFGCNMTLYRQRAHHVGIHSAITTRTRYLLYNLFEYSYFKEELYYFLKNFSNV